jgi:hypothetical protein
VIRWAEHRKNQRNSFVINDQKTNLSRDQKELDSRAQVSIVALPSSNVPRITAETKEATTGKAAIPSQNDPFWRGKVLTEKRLVVLVKNLSLGGKSSLRFTLCD